MDQATDLAYSRGDLQSQARAWLVRSELAWEEWLRPDTAAGQREQAVVSSLAALDAIESIRELQPDREVRAGAFSRWVFAYRRFAGRLLWPPGESPAPEDVALAFQVMERMRARTLLEAMDAAGATPAASPDTTPALALERLQVDMGRLSRGLGSPGLTGPQRRDLLAKLADLRLQASRLRDELARLDASYAALHAPVVAGLSQVREALLPDEALLLFQVANREGRNRSFEGGSWLLAVTRGGEAVHALPDLEEVQHAVALLVGLMDSDAALLATAAGRLYRDLLGEALARLPSRVGRLVIVADGPLHALPFEVLRERPGAPLLSERFLLSRSPSATAWLRWRLSPATTADRPALVLADPEHHAGPDDPAGLGPLPHARHEARALARALGRETKVLLGAAASEAALRPSGVSGFGILHLAAHTVVDEAEPGNSAVLLAPGGGGEDGWLRLKEVVALDLEGRAVVLSACRGAAGPQVDGEGMVSLAWAFFLGGARAVVASLWPLRDDEAGPLIGEFYRQLGRGRSMDEALARAQALRRAQGVAPSGWAGLRIIGDGHLIPFPSGGPGWVLAWWHLAALAGALAGACVWRALSLSRRRAWLAAAGL